MAEIVLDHVTKIFPNGVSAVRDLNLTIREGELVALVGPSGCGKTTTLRLIAGLEEPTAGTIRLGGQVANTWPPRQRDVALVFQKHSLYPHLTVRHNLAFGLRMRHGMSWLRPFRRAEGRRRDAMIAERVAEAAQLLNLEDVLDRFPAQLSGGQQQRVALGRAVVRQPGIFLLDEPLSHLDARLRADLRRQLHLLHQRFQATIIYVTHDQVEAMTLGERLLVLNQGVLQQAGPPGLIYQHPRNRFVAGFLGWPPMNLVDGRLTRANGRVFLIAGGQQLPLAPYNERDCERYLEQPVTFGIRPEHVSVVREGVPEARLTMAVVLVEPLGNEALVTFQRDAWRITAKMERRFQPAQGQVVEVAFDMAQSLLFDQASGLALGGGSPDG